MPAGRPSSYDPSFCDKVVEVGEKGGSLAEMAYECGVIRETINEWAKVRPEFSDALNKAQLASQIWWERKGRDGIEKPSSEFQGNLWSRNMAARFRNDWSERKEVEHSGSLDVSSKEQRDAAVAAAMRADGD